MSAKRQFRLPNLRLLRPNGLHRTTMRLVAWVLAAFAVYLMVLFGDLVVQEYRMAQDVTRKEIANAQLAQQQRDLQDRKAYVQSDAAIDIIAREQLDLAKPGDTVIQLNIVEPTPQPTTAIAPVQAAPAVPAANAPPNWRRWLQALFGS